MMPEESKKLFLTKYSTFGGEKFYKFLLNYAVSRLTVEKNTKKDIKNVSPELELIDYYEKFMILYRKDNEQTYLDIAKLFRKAANHIYRMMLKKNMIKKNSKFLNLVE